MKVLNTNKLAKKTVFVFKNAKGQNDFRTDPVSDPTSILGGTVLTFGNFDISFNK
ncbi:hypothetical protein [Pedobacter nototheniae]|uniref:hypothetical protein n=1 Tax=Pedobacter nototheniae TaxID=2488994 RepID=UPI0013F480D6|nr:hypothetical protein [Pedobacter nototheniae]